MKKIYLLFCFIFTIQGFTQNPADIEHTFGSYAGFNGIIRSQVFQSDGKILIGGDFQMYQGKNQNYLVRLNSDGSKDESFDIKMGFSYHVFSLAVQSDGKILVGGEFEKYQGVYQKYLLRLNPDGTIDDSFNLSGLRDKNYMRGIRNIILQSDGKILLSIYDLSDDKYHYSIIRLNADGSIDDSFSNETKFNDEINSIVLQPDGKIILGGSFNMFKGVPQRYLIRLNPDGTKDSSFDIKTGFNSSISYVALQKDGKIIVGGKFNNYQGTTQNKLVRLNPDGSKDNSFNIGTGFDFNINSIAIQEDGKIIVGGLFDSYNEINQKKLLRLNSDGSKDISFDIGDIFDFGFKYSAAVHNINLQPNGKIILIGAFTRFHNGFPHGLIRLNSDGKKDLSFSTGNGFYGSVNFMVQQVDKKVIVGGSVSVFQGINQDLLLRLNVDGSIDSSFVFNTFFNKFFVINSVLLQPDGKILVGGRYSDDKGLNRFFLIRLNSDGSKDKYFDIGDSFDAEIICMSLQKDSKIIVGLAYAQKSSLIRFNSDGSKDTSFDIGTGFDPFSRIGAIAVQHDGKIIVGGTFSKFKESPANGLIRLNSDGTQDFSFDIGTGFKNNKLSYEILSIVIQSDDKVLVGGSFSSYKEIAQNNLIRLNSDGNKDVTFDIGTGFNSAVANIVERNGRFFIVGHFDSFQGKSQNKLICLKSDGSKDETFDIGIGFDKNCSVQSILLQDDGKILVGGSFRTYQDNSNSASLIRLYGLYK
ncbi:delta-60 repeat domain-containing protein [Flavobacterium palustre]|uniref:Delta-60 repeat domain-containing protein n=1 Tax=Flavobacterium palustre TaxID=1476463 RepID=A0ABQ1HTI4_9FLAO|nr:hypothetical protein [Flavobacterium palustre]GGA88054.1 delta-60 repeat domain-containing protein [Flavobacterium palustre]